MSYRFNLSYYEYDNDEEPNDSNIIWFPEEWNSYLGNINFFNQMTSAYNYYWAKNQKNALNVLPKKYLLNYPPLALKNLQQVGVHATQHPKKRYRTSVPNAITLLGNVLLLNSNQNWQHGDPAAEHRI